MSAKANLDVLTRKVAYSGEGISVKSLETEIQQERVVQDSKVDKTAQDNKEVQTIKEVKDQKGLCLWN